MEVEGSLHLQAMGSAHPDASVQSATRAQEVMAVEVHKLTTERAIRIDCHIADRPCQGVVIDPGAMLNLMEPEAAKACGLRILGPSGAVVRMADGGRRPLLGYVKTSVDVAGVTANVLFHLMHTNAGYPALLGKPWLRLNQVVSFWGTDSHFIQSAEGGFLPLVGVPAQLTDSERVCELLDCITQETGAITGETAVMTSEPDDSDDCESESEATSEEMESEELEEETAEGYLVLVTREDESDEQDVPANELPLQDEPEDKRTLFAPNDDSGLVQGNLQPKVESSAQDVNQDVNIMENEEKNDTNKAALAVQFEETTLSIAFDDVFRGTESNGYAGDSKRTSGMSSESMGLLWDVRKAGRGVQPVAADAIYCMPPVTDCFHITVDNVKTLNVGDATTPE